MLAIQFFFFFFFWGGGGVRVQVQKGGMWEMMVLIFGMRFRVRV